MAYEVHGTATNNRVVQLLTNGKISNLPLVTGKTFTRPALVTDDNIFSNIAVQGLKKLKLNDSKYIAMYQMGTPENKTYISFVEYKNGGVVFTPYVSPTNGVPDSLVRISDTSFYAIQVGSDPTDGMYRNLNIFKYEFNGTAWTRTQMTTNPAAIRLAYNTNIWLYHAHAVGTDSLAIWCPNGNYSDGNWQIYKLEGGVLVRKVTSNTITYRDSEQIVQSRAIQFKGSTQYAIVFLESYQGTYEAFVYVNYLVYDTATNAFTTSSEQGCYVFRSSSGTDTADYGYAAISRSQDPIMFEQIDDYRYAIGLMGNSFSINQYNLYVDENRVWVDWQNKATETYVFSPVQAYDSWWMGKPFMFLGKEGVMYNMRVMRWMQSSGSTAYYDILLNKSIINGSETVISSSFVPMDDVRSTATYYQYMEVFSFPADNAFVWITNFVPNGASVGTFRRRTYRLDEQHDFFFGKPLGVLQENGKVISQGVASGFSNLKIGDKCYYDANGVINQTQGTYLGVAISPSKILIEDPVFTL